MENKKLEIELHFTLTHINCGFFTSNNFGVCITSHLLTIMLVKIKKPTFTLMGLNS
jgi:hypothetical protein